MRFVWKEDDCLVFKRCTLLSNIFDTSGHGRNYFFVKLSACLSECLSLCVCLSLSLFVLSLSLSLSLSLCYSVCFSIYVFMHWRRPDKNIGGKTKILGQMVLGIHGRSSIFWGTRPGTNP